MPVFFARVFAVILVPLAHILPFMFISLFSLNCLRLSLSDWVYWFGWRWRQWSGLDRSLSIKFSILWCRFLNFTDWSIALNILILDMIRHFVIIVEFRPGRWDRLKRWCSATRDPASSLLYVNVLWLMRVDSSLEVAGLDELLPRCPCPRRLGHMRISKSLIERLTGRIWNTSQDRWS